MPYVLMPDGNYVGLSLDIKPVTDIKTGAIFKELDGAGNRYIWNGTWALYPEDQMQDGSVVSLGAKADSAATDSTSAWSAIALLKGLIAKFSAANTGRTTGTLVQPVQSIDAGGKIVHGGDAANTARTSGTLVMPVQLVDATGKVLKARDAVGNAPFVKITNGTNTLAVDALGQISVAATAGSNNCTNYRLVAAAGNNLSNIKASAGKIMSLFITNTAAAVRYVKLYNKATAPVLASDTSAFTIGIPAGQTVALWNDGIGAYFATGMGISTTTGYGDTDTGALTAGDVVVNGTYI